MQELEDDGTFIRKVTPHSRERSDDAVVRLRIADRIEQAGDSVVPRSPEVELAHVLLDDFNSVALALAREREQLRAVVHTGHRKAELRELSSMAPRAAGDVEKVASADAFTFELISNKARLIRVRLRRVDDVVEAGVEPLIGVHTAAAAAAD